ncbi:rod shape-determining protein MreC [Patescibacteria group bacterium]
MFRQNSKKKKYILVILGIFLLLFFTIYIFRSFPPKFLKQTALFLIQPVVHFEDRITNIIAGIMISFSEKEDLDEENNFLKEKIKALELKNIIADNILKENDELKETLSRNRGANDFILASILSRPGYGIYNSLIIDIGSDDGIEKGTLVTAFGDVLLGHISEMTPSFSMVKLVSHPDEETNVFVGHSVSAIALGLGSENLSVALPHDIDINIGDKITTLGVGQLFLGIVEEIIMEPADPFQEIIFRLPVNIQELRHVYLIK